MRCDRIVARAAGQIVAYTMPLIRRERSATLDFIRGPINYPTMSIVWLDSQSRQSIRDFSLQLGIACALVAVPCLVGLRPWAESAQLLALVFTFYSICDIVRAMRKRDRFTAPSLNFWDEAMAFSGCSYLVRGLVDLHS